MGYLISSLLLTIESKKETDRPDSKSDGKKYAVNLIILVIYQKN